MKKKLLFCILIALISISIINCKDSSTDSQSNYKSPKEMTWVTDTLNPAEGAIQLLPVDMLAFSADDIWLACWSDVAKRVMWHLDGSKWIESDIEGQSGPIGLDAITGNSSSDLWAAGFYGKSSSNYAALSHYNGSVWEKTDLNLKGEILDMCTDPSGNIWACGRNGVILKYDGKNWIADTIKISFSYPVQYFLKSIQYYNSKIFVLASSINNNTLVEKYFYLTGEINNWTIADSMTLDSPSSQIKWGYRGLYASSFNNLYSYGLGGIWKYENKNWSKIKDVNGAIDGMYGISENYLLAVGDYQNVLFYDGNSWTNISNYLNPENSTITYWRVWTNGSETFIAGFGSIDDVEKTIIWHGS